MQAITPSATQHHGLPPMASRFVAVDTLPWHESPLHPGVKTKVLVTAPGSGLLTMLMQMSAGARLPDHEHVMIEQTWVLEGSLVCGEGECTAGNFVWRPAGSRHEAWAGASGALMLAMFQMPNRFFQSDGTAVDFAGNAWDPIWADALARQEQGSFD